MKRVPSVQIGTLFGGGGDMCSALFGSTYDPTPVGGFSISWGSPTLNNETSGTSLANPNSKVNTDVAFPKLCTRLVELGVAPVRSPRVCECAC